MSKRQTYRSDVTDEQWQLLRPLLLKRRTDKPGRPREVERRDLVDAILYIANRLPVAATTARFPSVGYRILPVPPLAHQRLVGAPPEHAPRPRT